MREFVDLPGASGAAYRFRAWPESDHHTPTAGNFAVLTFTGPAAVVVALGVTSDLSLAKTLASNADTEAKGLLFTRLNVSRAVRHAEHDDLAAQHPSAVRVHQDG